MRSIVATLALLAAISTAHAGPERAIKPGECLVYGTLPDGSGGLYIGMPEQCRYATADGITRGLYTGGSYVQPFTAEWARMCAAAYSSFNARTGYFTDWSGQDKPCSPIWDEGG